MTKDDAHYVEVDRLWRAVKRDYFPQVIAMAGFESLAEHERGWQRLRRNWLALCELDIDVAAMLAHGFREVSGMFDAARPTHGVTPSEHQLRGLSEILGVATKGREANPDAEVRTIGELYALGEEAIQREVDDATGTTTKEAS